MLTFTDVDVRSSLLWRSSVLLAFCECTIPWPGEPGATCGPQGWLRKVPKWLEVSKPIKSLRSILRYNEYPWNLVLDVFFGPFYHKYSGRNSEGSLFPTSFEVNKGINTCSCIVSFEPFAQFLKIVLVPQFSHPNVLIFSANLEGITW